MFKHRNMKKAEFRFWTQQLSSLIVSQRDILLVNSGILLMKILLTSCLTKTICQLMVAMGTAEMLTRISTTGLYHRV